MKRWFNRIFQTFLVLAVILLAPVLWVEATCWSRAAASDYRPVLPSESRRPEARTLLTYPEWHIVHAYDDYAEVIRQGDPHDFGFVSVVAGFWSSLCDLSRTSAQHGGFPWETKQMVYTIGLSFSVELALKAAYEETLGRLAVILRGERRAPLDDLSATQAGAYARFLQQEPWYRWDFRDDASALQAAAGDSLRDRERAVALGLEYRAKAAYAGVIEAAVAGVGADAPTMRAVVRGLPDGAAGVTVIATRPEGVEIETPRYRAFTTLAQALAAEGAEFVEIAGNDDILLTVLTDGPQELGALHRFARQGHGGYRHLLLVKVADLADRLRLYADGPVRVEHIHDY